MILEIVSREIVVAVHLGQVGFHLAGREALGGERDDHRVDPVQAALTLAHRLRVEAAVPIPRHLDLDRADLGEHRLRTGPVAAVAMVAAIRSVLLIAEVLVHLDFQAGLEDLLGQPGQQTARPDQIDPVGTRLLDELLGQRPLRPRPHRHRAMASPPPHPAQSSSVLPGERTAHRVRPDQLHRGSDSPTGIPLDS